MAASMASLANPVTNLEPETASWMEPEAFGCAKLLSNIPTLSWGWALVQGHSGVEHTMMLGTKETLWGWALQGTLWGWTLQGLGTPISGTHWGWAPWGWARSGTTEAFGAFFECLCLSAELCDLLRIALGRGP